MMMMMYDVAADADADRRLPLVVPLLLQASRAPMMLLLVRVVVVMWPFFRFLPGHDLRTNA